MNDTLEKDAAFLAGFIAGTYDLKGEADLPKFLKPVIERVMDKSSRSVTISQKTTLAAPNIPVRELSAGDIAKTAKKVVAAVETGESVHFADTNKKVRKPAADIDLRRRRDVSPEMMADIQKKRAQGRSCEKIGREPEYQVSGQTIMNWLKRNEKSQSSSHPDA